MNKTKYVLITGATGFLGTQIIQRILREPEHELLVLVRGEDQESTLRHLRRAWWEFPELLSALGVRIRLIVGDINHERLSLGESTYNELTSSLTHIIHTAADLRLNAPLDELRKTNRDGTINLIELGKRIDKDHGLERFSHVSTAYVAGKRKGFIDEESLTSEAGFLSNYERSKYEGELEVKNSNLPFSIFRPGMIVGDSKTGYIKTFNTLYAPLRLYLTGKQRFIPMDPKNKVNLIPVDYVADAIYDLTFNKGSEGLTFHLTAPPDSLPTVENLITFLRGWAQKKLNFDLPTPLYIPRLKNILTLLSKSRLVSNNQNKRTLETLQALSPYFNEKRDFSLTNTNQYFDKFEKNWDEYLANILDYAVYMGFLHRSERTVHEQIMFRLKSNSRPVNYYDIRNGDFKTSKTTDIREKILKVSSSLIELGVKKGDRIALVGHNSMRYLILDVAIGLVGGISVPIYYTSPYEEIKEILKDCKASVLFVGVPEILEKFADEVGFNVISFSSRRSSSKNNSRPGTRSLIRDWEDFLNLSKKPLQEISAPVDFSDLATVRYTSGTTGKPRGVMFSHGQLRWMAEYIASMPPWKNRNEPVSYLSFLPMNHVVEGIIGLYGPYYAPAPINIYFLENFQDLPRALSKVRPNIFFSVPRFYEKVWAEFSQKWHGKAYLNLSDGPLKKLLRKIIRKIILKKAGLDRCAQLIVGSAPVSEDLLKSYHDLGIEIYNAYGLTEAPLITINRLGVNRMGTVGEPLPHTTIKISSEGEVLVKGPQVMSGYYKQTSSSPFKDGWLLTGDFGELTPEGSLIISGRKKEVLVNSYGKTISPLKIESLLKDIPGVEEAMLIGEGKPYCSALLWFNKTDIPIDEVNQYVAKINSRVSRPEQIKNWVALKNDLTIENGDLTANLKLKRRNIIKRFEDVIDSIYEEDNLPDVILHMEIGGTYGFDKA
jgi:long-chain acyl-CoA synthetase